mmetsp:Transcript_11171/g.25008  ORF Transcript_11171/g.25008 Transcript_11171/m.25008 type:complete len:855 (-) Transcript_11171:201-2765(-)
MHKSGLSILIDEKKVNDLLRDRSGAKALLRSSCNLLFFIFFLLLYTVLVLAEPLDTYRVLEKYIRQRFDRGAAMQLEEVESIETFWQFMNVTFMPGLYGNDTSRYFFPGASVPVFLPVGATARGNGSLWLYGSGVRIRQVRVMPDIGCKTADPYAAVFTTCYGPYNEEAVETAAYGPFDDSGNNEFLFSMDAGEPVPGKLHTYAPGGFYEVLTANYNQSLTTLRLLEREQWVSQATRAIFLDFTFFNFNLGLYAVCRMSFEVSAGGSWVKTFSVEVLKERHLSPMGAGAAEDWAFLIGEAILVICVIFYLVEEMNEFLGFEKRKPTDPYTGVVRFATEEEAVKAVQGLDGLRRDEHNSLSAELRNKDKATRGRINPEAGDLIVIHGLGTGIDEASLMQLCQEFGTVTMARVVVNRSFLTALSDRIGRPAVKFHYFLDTWNLLDWTNLLLMIVALGLRISTWSKASSVSVFLGDPALAGVENFSDLSAVASNVNLLRALTSFNTVLTWFKAVKYISVVPYITLFMATVTASEKMLVSVIILFSAVLIGFTLAFNSAFGEKVSDFRNIFNGITFLMRSFLGDADLSVIYDSNPFFGAVLIILFILAVFFIIMNMFFAIMVSAFSDAKVAQSKEKQKAWRKTLERFEEFKQTTARNLSLELRMRLTFPGLYSRLMTRKKKQAEKEQQRDEYVSKKSRASQKRAEQDLDPGSPTAGRRSKPIASVAAAVEDDDRSEADLGPLRSQDQLLGQVSDEKSHSWDDSGMKANSSGFQDTGFSGGTDASGSTGLPPEGIDLLYQATEHVVGGIVDRTRAARGVLLSEMNESKEVLQGIGAVLEVLGRRARDLEAQQRQLLRHY